MIGDRLPQIFRKLGHLINVPGENFFYDVGSYLKMVEPGNLKNQTIGPGEQILPVVVA
jgi:hypothetical protein